MIKLIYNLLILIISLSILITIHEIGHFLTARLLGVGVKKAVIGIGPKIFIIRDKYGTEVIFSIIPLGGYIQIDDIVLYKNKKYLLKFFLILISGCVINLCFPVLILFLNFIFKNNIYLIFNIKHIIYNILNFLYLKNKNKLNYKKILLNKFFLDYNFKNIPPINYLLINKFKKTGALFLNTLNFNIKNIMGPIMIIYHSLMLLNQGYENFLIFILILSINIGIINLLPLSFLDGGKILYLLLYYYNIKNKYIFLIIDIISYIFFIIIILIYIYNDILFLTKLIFCK